jgi:Tol biopolymer transport system component
VTRAVEPRRARDPRDPYGLRAVGGAGAPIVALVGLLVVGWLTLGLLGAPVGVPGTAPGNNNPGVVATPAPSNVVIVPPKVEVPGSIIYVKAGNIWVQSGKGAHQVTTTGRASMPSWSPDGQWIYYVETTDEIGLFPFSGNARRYAMAVPAVMRVRPDGSNQPQRILSGRFRIGRYTWFRWLRQPVLSPDGRTIALLSDAPDPLRSDVVLQLLDVQSKQLTNPRLAETDGHQDPAWRPDGGALLYVRNGLDGARGTPTIYRYDPVAKRSAAFTGPGYLSPAWSRDGQYVAATRTDAFGTNIVILDGRRGTELLRLTDDDRSWSPVWSPKGDAIAFLRLENGIVDLRMVKLGGAAPNWTVGETTNLTTLSGLDGASHPGWFIPPNELPALETPSPSAAGGASPSASGQ